MNKESTANRLRYLMEANNLRQIDILNKTMPYCRKYNVKMNKSDLSQYVSGKAEPNQEKLFVLSSALNVSEAWLMGFDVPMARISEKNPAPKILEYYNNLNNLGKKEATKRVEELTYYPKYAAQYVNAAHIRTDIEITGELLKHDENIMDDENF